MTTTTQIKTLKRHVAQMRTQYDQEGMAALTLQVFQRGLDEWQPILAAANGEDGDSSIVSGHRRRMAQLFAFALQDWAEEHPEQDVTIEVARTMIAALSEKLGSVEEAAEALLQKYGEREIPVVGFDGDHKAQVLALQAANFGREEADMLGIAHSFRQALESGASPEEIARNAGQHLNYVLNHLALTDIPAELAQRIAAGELPMSVASTVADLPEPKRTGMAIFLLANDPAALTVKEIKPCAGALKKWNGIQVGLTFAQQTAAASRNIARALARLWGQVVEAYPEDAYAAATMLIYRGQHEEPWAGAEKAALWFQALGGDVYYNSSEGGAGINWPAVVEHLLTEVSCESCPLNQLPKQPLRSDLSGGQGGVLGMPCRVGEEASRCIHGLAPNDPFDVRVPWNWSEHEGVVHEGGHYRVKSFETLERAWQAQAAHEKNEDEAAMAKSEDVAASGTSSTSPASATPADTELDATQERSAAAPTGPSPVEKQRALIRDFMDEHGRLAVGHPFATGCASCRHFLDSSPTKDETVPHCAWADRPRRVHFNALRPVQNKGMVVPVCRQHAPTDAWETLIPEHPEPPGVPREWLREQILKLAAAGRTYGDAYHPFEFLTGRPMSSSQKYDDWFEKQLAEQIGNLSAGQLFTLLLWATAEWQRGQGKPFSLPLNDGVQFATYKMVDWREYRPQEKGDREQ